MYTRNKFGKDLREILNKSHDIVSIANWADSVYANHCRELPIELDDIVMALSAMIHGPEFVFTEDELHLLAEKLINNEPDSLQQIRDLKSKGMNQ